MTFSRSNSDMLLLIITITELLFQLPLKSLIRFLLVSSEWRKWMTNSYFIKMQVNYALHSKIHSAVLIHHKNYSGFLRTYIASFKNELLGNAVEIFPPLRSTDIRYCRGLVCLFSDCNQRFVIWNPFIKRHRILPQEFISNPEFETKFTFGYDAVNDDYKVLRVVEFQKKRPEVKLFSLNKHSWKRIQEVWPATNLGVNYNLSVCVNGTLHWLLLESNKYSIICFNLATEKFMYYKTPAQLDANRYKMCSLEAIKEKLCFTTVFKNEGKTYNEVWMMNNYGMDSSWTRFYKIEQASESTFFEYLKPVYLFSNGKEILLEVKNVPSSKLILRDIEKETEKKVENTTFPKKLYATEICFGSLLLLDDVDLIQESGALKQEKQ